MIVRRGSPLSASAPILSWQRVFFWLAVVLLLTGLPVVLLGALLPVNEYEAMGISGVDCDGPVKILAIGWAVYLVYGAGAVGFGTLALRRGVRRYAAAALLCFLVMAAVTPNFVRAWNTVPDEVCSLR